MIALAFLMASKASMAQCLGSCCSASCNTDITNHTETNKKGGWQVSTAYSVMQYKPFSDAQLLQRSTLENPAFTVQSQQSFKLGLQYNISERWRVSAAIPYNLSFDNREGHTHDDLIPEIHNYGNVFGLGDATFIGSYEWLPENKHGWEFSTGLGIKTPTGQTQVYGTTNTGLPPHLEPGTGSWDPAALAHVQKEIEQWTFSGDVFGKVATTANDHNMGNYLSGNIIGIVAVHGKTR